MPDHAETLMNDPKDMVQFAVLAGGDKDDQVKEALESEGNLGSDKKKDVSKYIRRRWDRLDRVMRQKHVELKVNYLRYTGNEFAQINPRDPLRIILPAPSGKRTPPVINKIKRAVHRYVAQVTADEPLMEALPATHSDDDRDAAEAATLTMRGEWVRMKLQREFQRVTHFAAVFRSGFWFFEWDDVAGGKTGAQKFFEDDKGNQQLRYVDGKGKEVEDSESAAQIWKGNIKVEVMTPMNVRWNGGRYAHEATELMVVKLPTLRDIYKSFPAAKEFKVNQLLGHEPPQGERWLMDLRGEKFASGTQGDDPTLTGTGSNLDDRDTILDNPVFLMHYFLQKSKEYPDGFHAIMAGKMIVFRGDLRYGIMPIAHFKLMDEISEQLGLGLVDVLRDAQELLTFIRSQILRHIQMMRRRWFLPQQANVNARDLSNPDKTTIVYNARAGARPEAETQPELSQSLFMVQQGAEDDFDDMLGIHALNQGKQVPGVQSGRQAEAIQSGDTTLLGLTRTQLTTGLEAAGICVLNMVKKEWTTERRVRFMGEDRLYIDKAFVRTDFKDTADVRLDRSTLLMLTKAQILEMMFGFAEVGALEPRDLRRLAPMGDVAGISLSEDEHYIKARRENEKLLAGPPQEAEEAYEEFTTEMDRLKNDMDIIERKKVIGAGLPLDAVSLGVEKQVQEVTEAFDGRMADFLAIPNISESSPDVAFIHIEEHARGRASLKIDRLPTWWVDWWDQNHFSVHLLAIAPPPDAGGSGSLGEEESSELSNPGSLPPPSSAGVAAQ